MFLERTSYHCHSGDVMIPFIKDIRHAKAQTIRHITKVITIYMTNKNFILDRKLLGRIARPDEGVRA